MKTVFFGQLQKRRKLFGVKQNKAKNKTKTKKNKVQNLKTESNVGTNPSRSKILRDVFAGSVTIIATQSMKNSVFIVTMAINRSRFRWTCLPTALRFQKKLLIKKDPNTLRCSPYPSDSRSSTCPVDCSYWNRLFCLPGKFYSANSCYSPQILQGTKQSVALTKFH